MNSKKIYKKKALTYGISLLRKQKLLNLIGNDLKNKKVLDIGCSSGYFGSVLKKKGAEVIGIDISPLAVKEAKKNLSDAILMDISEDKLPFKAKNFNIIILSEVIEHLLSAENILKEIYQVLDDDGILILSTPNFLYWGHRLNFLKGSFRYSDSGIFDRGHVHFFTYTTLNEEMNNARFRKIEEANIYMSHEIINLLLNKFPGLFAYQFVISYKKIV